MEEQSPTILSKNLNQAILATSDDPMNYQYNAEIDEDRNEFPFHAGAKSQLSAKDTNGVTYGMPPQPSNSSRKNQTLQPDEKGQGRRTAELHRKKMHSITEMRNPMP